MAVGPWPCTLSVEPFPRARLRTCSMLLMKVCGCAQRGVSTTKATMVGKADASASVMIAPDADQVKISICPGVSATMKRGGGSRGRSHSATTCAAACRGLKNPRFECAGAGVSSHCAQAAGADHLPAPQNRWRGGERRARRVCLAEVGGRGLFPAERAWSKRVANRLSAVRMPPLGPRLYCFMTFL